MKYFCKLTRKLASTKDNGTFLFYFWNIAENKACRKHLFYDVYNG